MRDNALISCKPHDTAICRLPADPARPGAAGKQSLWQKTCQTHLRLARFQGSGDTKDWFICKQLLQAAVCRIRVTFVICRSS